MYAPKYKRSVWDWNYYAMKQLPIVLMIMTIFAGIVLLVSPVLMNYMFPAVNESGRYASPILAKQALKRWFSSPEAGFDNVQSVRKNSQHMGVVSRFSFSVNRQPVEQFIQSRSLDQLTLTSDIMNTVFKDESLGWWKPESLTRETYFSGRHQGQKIALIYNAEEERGLLQISNF